MITKEFEFRGIPLNAHCTYLEELGAKKCTDVFPIFYEDHNWRAEILNEKIIAFTSVIKVNSIIIRFAADNEEIMEHILKKYRHKTIRAGG